MDLNAVVRARPPYRAMLFQRRRPAPPLDAFVESVWLCKQDRRPRELERILPSGGAQLIVNLAEDETRLYAGAREGVVCHRSPGSILTGITTRFQIIDTDEEQHVAVQGRAQFSSLGAATGE